LELGQAGTGSHCMFITKTKRPINIAGEVRSHKKQNDRERLVRKDKKTHQKKARKARKPHQEKERKAKKHIKKRIRRPRNPIKREKPNQ
jgi:hypothetical protein